MSSQIFTASGTFTAPVGVSLVDVTCWGGGGGAQYTGGKGGGGGGAYAKKFNIPVTPGNTYTVTVSAAIGPADGNSSSFVGDSSVTCLAVGGKTTITLVGGPGGLASACTGDITYSGGTGGAGATQGGGGGGAAAGSTGNGANGGDATFGSSAAGGVGSGGGGSGGDGYAFSGALNIDGYQPGGGGGGSRNVVNNGGFGGAGEVLIEWVPPVIVPFIPSATTLYTPSLQGNVTVPFIASHTVVYPPFSIYSDIPGTGPGNGGETFQVVLAPNGTSVVATLVTGLTATASAMTLSGDSGMPSTNAFCVTIDSETLYVIPLGAHNYRIRSRGLGNTAPATHTAGASVTWGDSYDMAILSTVAIDATVTANVDGSGIITYPGWLICFDSSQGYLGGSRYPMHVTEMVGVYTPNTGVSGSSKLDSAQPNSVCTPAAVSDDCPAALSNPALVTTGIVAGDVAVVRYTNPEAGALTLGPRSTAIQSWFGMKRVDATDHDVTFTDPTGTVIDASINAEFLNPLGPGIDPTTGGPTVTDVPYTSVTMPGTDRYFTYGPPHYSEKGWPIGVVAVRQGANRIPYWESYDWHNYNYVTAGYVTDGTFCQLVVNRNGIVFGSSPTVALPGPQNISGTDTVWDNGSYYFGVSWYVAIWQGPYLIAGPGLGGAAPGGGGAGGGGGQTVGFVPGVEFPGGPPVIVVPTVEGGNGGGFNPNPTTTGVFSAQVV